MSGAHVVMGWDAAGCGTATARSSSAAKLVARAAAICGPERCGQWMASVRSNPVSRGANLRGERGLQTESALSISLHLDSRPAQEGRGQGQGFSAPWAGQPGQSMHRCTSDFCPMRSSVTGGPTVGSLQRSGFERGRMSASGGLSARLCQTSAMYNYVTYAATREDIPGRGNAANRGDRLGLLARARQH